MVEVIEIPEKKRMHNELFLIIIFVIFLLTSILLLSIEDAKKSRDLAFIKSQEKGPPSNQLSITRGLLELGFQDYYSGGDLRHWAQMPITFKVDKTCAEFIQLNIYDAFEKIENETDGYISFKEVLLEEPEIQVNCEPTIFVKEEAPIKGASTYFVHPQDQMVITSAIVTIFGQGQMCATGYPSLEVHEILHAFDLDHVSVSSSIMFPYTASSSKKCTTTQIDEDTISCLKSVYSNNTLPEESCDFFKENKIVSDNPCPNGWFQTDNDETFCCPIKGMNVSEDGFCTGP